jgi:tetratricopeptide (TPR) repeat protein
MRSLKFIFYQKYYFLVMLSQLLSLELYAQSETPSTVIGTGNAFLSTGSFAISIGQYDEGIRLTELGIDQGSLNMTDRDKAVALSNLCAAYAAKGDAAAAIKRCNESIVLTSNNWRSYINRAYAYFLLNQLTEARLDIDATNALNPGSRQVIQLRGMINEKAYQPRVIMEDHQ